ncbi:MAG: orotidine-5'-phosphate decarboxylase [Armatimonadetes bacterium]|nr:orotidine-5'-phosphate decarboxylase [Armatimonadota bacterium]
MKHKIICAIDTGDLDEATSIVRRLAPYAGAFKIGHGLTLPHGLDVIDRLNDAGAERIFLDMKFHDIPSSVAIGVREAAKKGVWMLTLHLAGGPAMITAAVEEAQEHAMVVRPMLVGVSVLTSMNENDLRDWNGVSRSIPEQMVALSERGVNLGLDGVVCSVHEAAAIRKVVGHGVIVTPGIRSVKGESHDQNRIGDGRDALDAGADYMVIGRALTNAADPEQAIRDLRLMEPVA